MTDKKIIINQDSGFNSDAEQSQTVHVGDQYQGDVYKKLVAIHDEIISFDPHSLKEIIVEIDKGIKDPEFGQIDYSTGIDIKEKNGINNHSIDYFEQFVELDFYPQFYKLDQFFALKENQHSLQNKVDRVIKSLNRKILAFQGTQCFEGVLLNICTKLIDENYATLKDKEDEILLVLYYFYCNCCIGKKTKEEKNVSSK